MTETRTGYSYSVDVNDPDGDAVSVTLEIWDPSDGVWLAQPPQLVQGRGRLSWDVSEPFDVWDSGQESRFRFSYSNGDVEGALKEIAGPLTIPTLPWYVYYGQRASATADTQDCSRPFAVEGPGGIAGVVDGTSNRFKQ